jgi:hypothetical protein
VHGQFDAEYLDSQSLSSPSHDIDVHSANGECHVTLAGKAEIPDRDFVLRWNEVNTDAVSPRAWVREKGAERYALLEVRAPKQVSTLSTALDFYFLVDRSGSMQGSKWEKAVEALQSCMDVLGPQDRAMVTLFETGFQDFAEEPLPVRELVGDRRFRELASIGTGGGTDMAPALKHVLEIASRKSHGRDSNLILITDAQIGNETAILDLMKTAPEMAVHCFGIDIALNDALLFALSRQQGGSFHSMNPNDDIRSAVTRLAKTIRQPVLLDLELSEGWECADARIPNLYAGQILYLSAKATQARPPGLKARTPSGEQVSFDFQQALVDQEGPYLNWCKTRIQRLLAENLGRQAVELSVASNLLCRLTAFIAWDESEKVAVSRHELVQPVMELAAASTRFALLPAAPAGLAERRTLADGDFPRRFGIGRKSLQQRWDATFEDLRAACRKLGGSELKEACQRILDWFSHARGAEHLRQMRALRLLLQKLNLCSELREALDCHRFFGNAKVIKRVRLCVLEFRKMQQECNGSGEDCKDVEQLFRSAELVNSSTSAEQLSLLAEEINQAMITMLNLFSKELMAGN